MTISNLKLAAGAAALIAAGFAGAAVAHPHPEGEGKVRQIILVDGKPGEKRAHRTIRLDGDRPVCTGEKTEVVEETGGEDKKQKTRIVICGKEGMASADRAARLQEAIDRIQANDELSAEHREKVTTALREAMERVRAGN